MSPNTNTQKRHWNNCERWQSQSDSPFGEGIFLRLHGDQPLNDFMGLRESCLSDLQVVEAMRSDICKCHAEFIEPEAQK